METKLTSAAFIAAIFASSVTWAQQSAQDSTMCKQPDHSESTKAKTTRGKEHKAASETTSSSKAKSSEKGKSTDLGSELKEQEEKNELEAQKPRKEPTAAEKEKAQKEAKKQGPVGTATTTAADVVRDVTSAADRPGKYNPLAIEYNPLSLFIGRVSFNVEWAPATHHVIIASPHFAYPGSTIATSPDTTFEEHVIGGGGELGYRYYTGHRGMNGVFGGASIIGGAYSADLPEGNKAFTNIGVAADVGVQWVLYNHLVLGAGAGLEYLHVSHDFHDLPTRPATLAQSGVKPRALASVGYGF